MTFAQFWIDVLKSFASALVVSLVLAFALKGAYRVVLVGRLPYIAAYIQSFAVFMLQSVFFGIGLMLNLRSPLANGAWFALCAYVLPVCWWARMLPTDDGRRAGVLAAVLFALVVGLEIVAVFVAGFGAYTFAAAAQRAERLAGGAFLVLAGGIAGALYLTHWVRMRARGRRTAPAPAEATAA
jgi:hypothetical protein